VANALNFGVAGVVLALGCTSEVEPIQVADVCPSQPVRGPAQSALLPQQEWIDDFESGDEQIMRVDGRDGFWVVGADGTALELTAETSTRCAARGGYAGHFLGGKRSDWGVNWTAVLKKGSGNQAASIDASGYSGVSFWAAVGPGSVTPFELPVGVTTLDVAWNGGVCTKCMDFYRKRVTLSTRWQQVVLRFEDLEQSGYGLPQTPLNRAELVGFIIWPDQPFDVWIDDVHFIR